MIDETKAKELVKKYCPDVMLVINDGADGLYLHNSQEILIGKNWHIAGLLHEITHAVLNADEPRTCHDGVFADKFTQIVHEVFEKENIKLKTQLSIAVKCLKQYADIDNWYNIYKPNSLDECPIAYKKKWKKEYGYKQAEKVLEKIEELNR